MYANDFRGAGELLHDEYLLEWPQSGERIRGRDIFVAITFSTIHNGKILYQTEYWPDPFDAPDWRARWVEKVEIKDEK